MLQQPPCLGMMLLHPRIQPRRIHQQAEDFAQPCFVIVEADELGKAFLRFKARPPAEYTLSSIKYPFTVGSGFPERSNGMRFSNASFSLAGRTSHAGEWVR